jgi:competence protein ComEC
VPQKRAIDIINGRHYYFIGDSDLLVNDFARNFHLKPARILYRINDSQNIPDFSIAENYNNFKGRHILLIDKSISFTPVSNKPTIDLLVISKNPKLYITKLAASLTIKQVVFDGSVPAWKATYWKRDCDSLHIPWHDVTTNGAYEMKL